MPTRRMIDPAIWQSESMAELTRDQRLLFIGLFSNADDQGRLRGNANLIRSQVFPFDDDLSSDQIKRDLEAIAAQDCIIIYEVDGKELIQIIKWWDYQSPQWAYPSKYPAPLGWNDRLRYRQDNRVIVYNWKPDHSDYTPPPDDPDEPQLPPDSPNGLGDALPNALPNGLGSPVRLELEIENKEEEKTRAMLMCVSNVYQQEIGSTSPYIRDELLDFCQTYPEEWIKLAISGAAEQNIRKLSYIRGTLRNWQAVGGPQNDKPTYKSNNGNGFHPPGVSQPSERSASITAALNRAKRAT